MEIIKDRSIEIHNTKDRDIDILTVKGKVDFVASRILNDEIMPYIIKGGKVIINLKGCDYMAISGLRVLLAFAKQSEAVGCRMVLLGAHPDVRELLGMMGHRDLFEIYDTMTQATSAVWSSIQ